MQSLVTKPVVFLVGPTASGKTAHAYRLVDAMRDVGKVADGTGSSLFEIVSVDSALVYKDMNIGTAKPSAAELAVYPHRLIDLITPEEAYSAADFRRDALASIAEIHARGRVPLLVGGTMMYVKALVDGLSALPPADAALRVEIEADAAREGWPALHARLARIDPATAARLKPNDAQRIQRALEVYRLVGVPLSELQTRSASASDWAYPSLYLGLMPHERTSLHARIARRFDAMLDAGLVDEVRQLRKTYRLTPELPSMRCVGYRQTWAYLDGEFNLDECRRTAIVATRQLAKRQMTWMRSMPQLRCFDSESAETGAQLEAAVRDMLDATTQSGT